MAVSAERILEIRKQVGWQVIEIQNVREALEVMDQAHSAIAFFPPNLGEDFRKMTLTNHTNAVAYVRGYFEGKN